MILTYKKGKEDKIHISVDGEYFITVDELYFRSLNLKNGQEIDEHELTELKEKIDFRRAFNYAVTLLSKRAHSEYELIAKLKRKGFSSGIDEVLEKLRGFGYTDDRSFAHLYAQELINIKKYGKKRIEQELYRKGIDRDIVKDIVYNIEIPDDRLLVLIERKYMRYLNDEKGINKTVNSLLRLGYSYPEIKNAIKEIIQREEFDFAEE